MASATEKGRDSLHLDSAVPNRRDLICHVVIDNPHVAGDM